MKRKTSRSVSWYIREALLVADDPDRVEAQRVSSIVLSKIDQNRESTNISTGKLCGRIHTEKTRLRLKFGGPITKAKLQAYQLGNAIQPVVTSFGIDFVPEKKNETTTGDMIHMVALEAALDFVKACHSFDQAEQAFSILKKLRS